MWRHGFGCAVLFFGSKEEDLTQRAQRSERRGRREENPGVQPGIIPQKTRDGAAVAVATREETQEHSPFGFAQGRQE